MLRASFWTQVGAMALPLGVSLIALATILNEQKDRLIFAGLLSIIIGFVSFVLGWTYLVKEEREAVNRRTDEQTQRKNDEMRNQQEHDEIMAMLAGTLTGKRMSSPRILRFIEKLREIEGRGSEDE